MQYYKNNAYFNQLNEDDKNLVSKVLDMLEACENKCISKFSFFLDERQCLVAESILKLEKFDNYLLYGGFSKAKRRVLGIFPRDAIPNEQDFPISAVEFSYRKQDKLLHKDFLGAIMSHKIKRDALGDILVNEDGTVAFIYNTVSDFLIGEIDKIGAVGVKLSISDKHDYAVKESFQEMIGAVSSLRADCILSFAVKQSREKTVLLIKSIGIDINYKKIYSPSEILKKGDIFSLRGYGKFILSETGGMSRKGRTYITIKKYI